MDKQQLEKTLEAFEWIREKNKDKKGNFFICHEIVEYCIEKYNITELDNYKSYLFVSHPQIDIITEWLMSKKFIAVAHYNAWPTNSAWWDIFGETGRLNREAFVVELINILKEEIKNK